MNLRNVESLHTVLEVAKCIASSLYAAVSPPNRETSNNTVMERTHD